MQSGALSKKVFGVIVSIAMVVGLQIPGIAFAGGGDSGLTAQSLAGGAGAVAKLQTVTVQGTDGASPVAWDGATATEWTKGSGTQEDPYLIESAENLAYLRNQVNEGSKYTDTYFKQTVDIDLNNKSWIPIGKYESYSKSYPFAGHYDGDGNTVSGLSVSQANYAGLFGYVIGASASSPASLSGIVVEGAVEGTGTASLTTNYAGGVSAYCQFVTIRNCGNNASVTSTGQNVGGVTGNALTCTVECCYNHGAVTSTYETSSAGGYAGGIASRLTSTVTNIVNCYNTGNVTSTFYAGGIAGNAPQSTSNIRVVQNCFNAGSIVGTTSNATYQGRVGGVLGGYEGGNSTYKAKTVISDCWSVSGSPAKSVVGWPDAYETYLQVSNCGGKSADEMKSAAFVSTLGEKFIAGVTYPALYWEAPAGIPVITTHPEGVAYVKGTPATALSVTAEGDAANGELQYQWHKASAEDLSDAAAIEGATNATYTPPTTELGSVYYYCTVNNNVQKLDGSGPYLVQSNTACVQVWSGAQAVVPVITVQPTVPAGEAEQGSDAGSLTIQAAFGGQDETADNCILGYQWQVSDAPGGSYSNIDGATESSLAIPTDKLGTRYYRCVVTTTREKQSTASTSSEAASITVKGLEIDSLEKLQQFAKAVDDGDTFEGKTVVVTADITISGDWNPAGTWSTSLPIDTTGAFKNGHPFQGEFDGQGHTITFAANDTSEQYYGIIAATCNGAYIHDLVVAGEITSSKSAVAGVVGQAAGSTTFERVGNKAKIKTTGASSATVACNAGGIVGVVGKPALPTGAPTQTYTFKNCYNKGDVAGNGRFVGGIAGCGAETMVFESCYNRGEVSTSATSTSSSAGNVGGILGGCASTTGVSFALKNCYSTGAISATGLTGSAASNSGALNGCSSAANPENDDTSYYLEGVSERGRAGTAAQPSGYVSKTAAEFSDESSETGVLALLNNATYAGTWKAGSALDPAQASPILAWEAPESEPTKFTIAFVDEDNTELLAGKEYAEGTKADDVEKPSNPTKTANPDDGYTYAFDKWVDSATGAADVADVTADATYKATYTKTAKEYSITYDLDGGTEADPANPTAYTVETEDFALAAPSREGHSFAGWTGTGIAEASTEVTVAKGSTGNRAYKATWSKNAYDVTFDSDGGSAVDKQTVEHGSTAAKPADPAKDGFDFVEWQKDGAAFDFATEITGETQLKAVWKEKQKEQTSGESGTNPSGSNEGKSETTPSSDSGNSSAGAAQSATPAQSATTPAQSAAAAPAKNGAAAAKASTVAPSLKAAQVSNTSVKLAWGKVAGAAKYVLYGNKCSTKNQLKKIATVKGTSYKVVKAAGKKLKKGAYYKFQVRAYDAKGKLLAKTLLTHVVTTGGKYCNIKKVTTKAKNNKISLKVGKSFKLGAKQVRESKKLKFNQHVGLRYATSDKAVATVSKTGAVTAKKAGTCYVYATAQNGVFAKVKVTVK